ncbi:hypothetical protein Bbelb_425680 [Branchiostoma belcheri]|nr:hypothetical protein Bbelb_425680 [Branchiostoma belcheri]
MTTVSITHFLSCSDDRHVDSDLSDSPVHPAASTDSWDSTAGVLLNNSPIHHKFLVRGRNEKDVHCTSALRVPGAVQGMYGNVTGENTAMAELQAKSRDCLSTCSCNTFAKV